MTQAYMLSPLLEPTSTVAMQVKVLATANNQNLV